jgi:hypothetical protein
MALQHLRSSTANKRPLPASMADGQVAINTNTASPGLFLKDSGSGLLKIGPTHIGSTAPNASPAAGGQTGNSVGEQWLDTSTTNPVLKVWNGSAWAIVAAAVLATARQINGTNFDGSASITTAEWGTGRTVTIGSTARTVNGSQNVSWTLAEIGAQAAGNYVTTDNVNQTIAGTKTFSSLISGSVSGNAGTATTLATARNINGTSFNGSGNITTAEWGTSRNLTIGNTVRSVNGSTNYSWSLSDIGALPAAGGTATGAISAPSFIPTGNTAPTNGVYLPAANSVAISTNGSERIRILSDGKLGLGTGSPLQALHVQGGSINASDSLIRCGITAAFNSLLIGYSGTGDITDEAPAIYATNTTGSTGLAGHIAYKARSDSARDHIFYTGTTPTERLRITSTGNVGIGTTSPATALDVNGDVTITDKIIHGGDTNTAIRFPAADTVSVETAGSERARITSDGRLGLGTSSPGAPLEIVGKSAEGVTGLFRPSLATASDIARIELRGVSSVGTASQQVYFDSYQPSGGGGSDTALDIRVRKNADTFNNPSTIMTLRGTGNVGIGTTSPSTLLHVEGSSPTSGEGVIRVRNNNTTTGRPSYGIGVTRQNTDTRALLLGSDDSNNGAIGVNGNLSIIFGKDVVNVWSEHARIDSAGRLLLNTSSAYFAPASSVSAPLLQVHATNNHLSQLMIGSWASGTDVGPNLTLARAASGAVGDFTAALPTARTLGNIRFIGSDGTKFIEGAKISANADAGWATDDGSTRLAFFVTPGGASSPTEALRITNDRVVAYNQAAPAAVNTTATITAANLKTGIITSTTAAAVTMTLPTGTNIEAGFSSIYTNMTFEFSVINTGPNTLTVGANGNTTVGSLTVATLTSARYALRRTGANAFTLYRLS